VFVHEFSGDYRSWKRRCAISGAATAASPSTRAVTRVGRAESAQPLLAGDRHDDVAAVMRHLKLRKAHIAGCSMGASTALNFGIHHANSRALGDLGRAGAGSDPARHAAYLRTTEANARRFETLGMPAAARAAA